MERRYRDHQARRGALYLGILGAALAGPAATERATQIMHVMRRCRVDYHNASMIDAVKNPAWRWVRKA